MLEWMQSLLLQHGYAALFLVLFLNNAGLPLPGTTMLLGAGFLVQGRSLSLLAVAATGALACFLGSNFGYWVGGKFGPVLLRKVRWLHLTRRKMVHMERFFKRYGPKGVFFARFVALLHPFIGLMSGVGKTPKGPFLFYNLLGSILYAVLYTLAGSYFGRQWGLHEVWIVHFSFFLLVLVVVLLLLRFFWSHSIHSFLGFVFFKKMSKRRSRF